MASGYPEPDPNPYPHGFIPTAMGMGMVHVSPLWVTYRYELGMGHYLLWARNLENSLILINIHHGTIIWQDLQQ